MCSNEKMNIHLHESIVPLALYVINMVAVAKDNNYSAQCMYIL